MNFLLKIVEGPNKGAEIALVSGVAVTLGKGDDCDIVLADPTLPPTPVSIEASDVGVTADGEPLEQFAVKTAGATSFAVGPADAPWGELKWPKKVESESREPEAETGSREVKHETPSESRETGGAPQASSQPPEDDGSSKKRRGGFCGCLVALALLILALVFLAWFYRAAIKDSCRARGYDLPWLAAPSDRPDEPAPSERLALASVAARYGLSVEDDDGHAKLTGNLKTRAERLRATAEAYEARPGVELDISDDESFRTAADDALFTLTEGALRVVSATNRVLAIRGIARSPEALRRTLAALNSDIPRLRNVDVAGVRCTDAGKHESSVDAASGSLYGGIAQSHVAKLPGDKTSRRTSPLPVCGILTKPYPCLVLRDGTRVLEGAPLGENVILKIDADEVTVTNSTGRFTWKP